LVRRLFPERAYVSLDLPSEAEQAERDPDSFLARHGAPLVVDEVQYAPGLFRHLKRVVDRKRSEPGQFVLTGSQKLALMREVSDSLAGRAEILELEALSLAELRGGGIDASVESVAVRGGMPELWERPELDATAFQRSYVSTYLERDLRLQLNVGSLRDFERFVRACALRSAGVLNKTELARDIGISTSTASAWLSVLEASGQLFVLEPWFSNGTKSLVKTPKLHVADSGLLSFLVGLRAPSDLVDSPLGGAVWESFVCSELRRSLRSGRREGDLYYWRDRAREVDFLVHRAGRFELYDAKRTAHPSDGDAAPLHAVAATLRKGSVVRKAIVCRTSNAYPLADGAEAMPAEAL
jgi:predicted AAA+ superfamily ATPase